MKKNCTIPFLSLLCQIIVISQPLFYQILIGVTPPEIFLCYVCLSLIPSLTLPFIGITLGIIGLASNRTIKGIIMSVLGIAIPVFLFVLFIALLSQGIIVIRLM